MSQADSRTGDHVGSHKRWLKGFVKKGKRLEMQGEKACGQH